jgi:hypothetical protein
LFIRFHLNGMIKKLYRYTDETGNLVNKIMFNEDGELFLWTLLDPSHKGEAIQHIKTL